MSKKKSSKKDIEEVQEVQEAQDVEVEINLYDPLPDISQVVEQANKVSNLNITEFSIMSYGHNKETKKIDIMLKNGKVINL